MFKESYSYEEATPKITDLLSVELRNEDAIQIVFEQCRIVRLSYISQNSKC